MTSNYTISAYATKEDLAAFIGDAYPMPTDDEAVRMLTRAAELIYDMSGNLSERAYLGTLSSGYFGYVDPQTVPAYLTLVDYKRGLLKAVCAQVEFWLEYGEEHDVLGLTGMVGAGKVQVSQNPGRLAPRAAGYLRSMGLSGTKVGIR